MNAALLALALAGVSPFSGSPIVRGDHVALVSGGPIVGWTNPKSAILRDSPDANIRSGTLATVLSKHQVAIFDTGRKEYCFVVKIDGTGTVIAVDEDWVHKLGLPDVAKQIYQDHGTRMRSFAAKTIPKNHRGRIVHQQGLVKIQADICKAHQITPAELKMILAIGNEQEWPQTAPPPAKGINR